MSLPEKQKITLFICVVFVFLFLFFEMDNAIKRVNAIKTNVQNTHHKNNVHFHFATPFAIRLRKRNNAIQPILLIPSHTHSNSPTLIKEGQPFVVSPIFSSGRLQQSKEFLQIRRQTLKKILLLLVQISELS